eukprot:CAMPEP_0172499494 /NCGR_PEP_ID=MMETSP1066-20121228/128053_1 /TAXON_ID=671091 /ORGANISM="Coscinodiscus wailesii, Strain CCMP2513" /LENGTH=84 /DNA_ID=CAMNT_0013273273 /DNA_START=186 /DNA_END=437 /DNA_ORIENTATION=+
MTVSLATSRVTIPQNDAPSSRRAARERDTVDDVALANETPSSSSSSSCGERCDPQARAIKECMDSIRARDGASTACLKDAVDAW